MPDATKSDATNGQPYDIVLTGGTVFGAGEASSSGQVTDVAIRGGTVAAIGPDLAAGAAEVVDCGGQWVLPGLVEGHTHIFHWVSKVGAPPEEAHLRRGVVAACDAGTAGASTFPAFQRLIVEPSAMRIVNLLNVSVLGLIDFRFGELLNPNTLSADDALATAQAHPEIVRGFKLRLSEDVVGDQCLPLLKRSLALGESAGLPLMVHIGETPEPLPAILDLLRAGDIVSHCYTGKANGILDDAGVISAVHAARARGVVFDSAHGRSNLSFAVARRALAEGFLPDVISSDTSARNWRGPVFDLVTTMSKFLALGLSMAEIAPRVTSAPAKLLGLDAEGYGSLTVGGPAHVTVLERLAEADTLPDASGGHVVAPRLEPTLVLAAGQRIQTSPWRGRAAADALVTG
jgi:dihydroorotase